MTPTTQQQETWIEAGEYSLMFDGHDIIARNAKGKILTAVPAKAKKHEAYEQLDALRAFLGQHAETCRATVRNWFLAGLPVPVSVLTAVWADDAWRAVLTDLVITDGQLTGLLRGADESGLKLVDLDGETTEIPESSATTVTIPHPALMEDLPDWREFAVELGVHQGLDQLFREVTAKPADERSQNQAVAAYREGSYDSGGHLIGRARGAGFTASLEAVSTTVEEGGRTVTAELGVYGDLPEDPASIGDLSFHVDGVTVPLSEVGPVAWSEGIRMCEYVWAGRTIEHEEK